MNEQKRAWSGSRGVGQRPGGPIQAVAICPLNNMRLPSQEEAGRGSGPRREGRQRPTARQGRWAGLGSRTTREPGGGRWAARQRGLGLEQLHHGRLLVHLGHLARGLALSVLDGLIRAPAGSRRGRGRGKAAGASAGDARGAAHVPASARRLGGLQGSRCVGAAWLAGPQTGHPPAPTTLLTSPAAAWRPPGCRSRRRSAARCSRWRRQRSRQRPPPAAPARVAGRGEQRGRGRGWDGCSRAGRRLRARDSCRGNAA